MAIGLNCVFPVNDISKPWLEVVDYFIKDNYHIAKYPSAPWFRKKE